MLENTASSTSDTFEPGKLIRVDAGAVKREAILTLPEKAQGVILLATSTPLAHKEGIVLAQAFHRQNLGSLLVDLFSSEELQMDEETGYFRENTDIMQQRIAGIAEWLLQQPETQHCSVGYFGLGIVGAAMLIAAAERPDVVAGIVAGGAQLETVKENHLQTITAPTLLFALEQDDEKVQASQQALEQIIVEKQFLSLPNTSTYFENNQPLPELMNQTVAWFNKHLTWIPSPSEI